MAIADIKYGELITNVLENGMWENGNRTGIPTKKLFGQQLSFNLEQEFPILTQKFSSPETLKRELFWIYVFQSNDVNFLEQELNVKVWNEWKKEDGTIGPGYGWQVKNYNQIENLINGLRNKPFDRGHIINLWSLEHLNEMALRPCAFMTMWDVSPDGYLNCTLVQRSADLGLGVPFNFAQYAILIYMVAHVTGLKPGLFNHYMNNAHIYENHIDALKYQLTLPIYDAPQLWINPEIKEFKDFTLYDVKILNYKHGPKIRMDVAI